MVASTARPTPVSARCSVASAASAPKSEGDDDGTDVDIAIPGSSKDAGHDVGIGLGEHPGGGSTRLGQLAVAQQRGTGDGEPVVGGQGLPAGDAQACPVAQAARDVGERGARVVEEHRSEPTDRHVVGARRQGVGLGVGLLQRDVGEGGIVDALAGDVEHRRGQVDATDGVVDDG